MTNNNDKQQWKTTMTKNNDQYGCSNDNYGNNNDQYGNNNDKYGNHNNNANKYNRIMTTSGKMITTTLWSMITETKTKTTTLWSWSLVTSPSCSLGIHRCERQILGSAYWVAECGPQVVAIFMLIWSSLCWYDNSCLWSTFKCSRCEFCFSRWWFWWWWW